MMLPKPLHDLFAIIGSPLQTPGFRPSEERRYPGLDHPIGLCLGVLLVLFAAVPGKTISGDAPLTGHRMTQSQEAPFLPMIDRIESHLSVPRESAVVRLLAASGDEAASSPAAREQSGPLSLGERVRRAGQMIVEGNTVRASEVIREALRECQSGEGDLRDCSEWMQALRGLSAIMGKPGDKIVLTNSIGMKMVRIPAGEYMMGSPKQEMDWVRLTFKKIWREGHKQWFQDELPLHPVRINRPFYLGSTEVTVRQFRQFVLDTGYKTDAEKGDGGMIFSKKEERWVPQKNMKWSSVPWKIADDQPVVFVSWNDAQAFCKWLTQKEKRTYRLPSEAEWEMVCRGGHAWVRFPWGNRLPGDRDLNFGDGNPKLPESLTTIDDGYVYVSPVGSYPPNGYGVYDMDGNVMEWVADYYERNYFENSPLEDPQGPRTGTSRVNKGGNWYGSPTDCRCAFRGFSGQDMSFWNLGFRVALEDRDESKPTVASKTGGDETSSSREDPSAFPPTEAEGIRLFRQAMFSAQQQQWDQATQDLEEALRVYEKRQDLMWVARVRATLAGLYAERTRTYKSKELYTQALAEFRKLGDAGSARIILARLQELETSPGVKVVEVKKGSLAAKAGIVPNDVIIEYAGETGFRVAGFKKLVEDHARDEQVTVSVMNDNQITTTVLHGGTLGVALEDIRRPPRARRQDEPRPPREGDRRRPPQQRRQNQRR